MAIPLPSEKRVPFGPHRDFLVSLHALYDQAGRPATRAISSHVYRSRGLEQVSHETVGSALSGSSIPSWAKVRSIVVALGQLSGDHGDQRGRVDGFQLLWKTARAAKSDATALRMEPPSTAELHDPIELLDPYEVLHGAIAGRQFRLAEATLAALADRAPDRAQHLRAQLGFLQLPMADRDLLASLWAQLTTVVNGADLLERHPGVIPEGSPTVDQETRRPGAVQVKSIVLDVFGIDVPLMGPGDRAEFTVAAPAGAGGRCHVILLNTSQPVDIAMFAPELVKREATLVREGIDHLVVLSLDSGISAELRNVERDWDERGAYPFSVRLFGAEDFVGDALDQFPARLRDALRRRVALPEDWRDYVATPARLCLRGESAAALDDIFAHQLPMRAVSESGSVLAGTLLSHVRRWLDLVEEPTLLLVGDFGDGKSFFTYNLARRLCAEASRGEDPVRVPLRLSLAELPAAGSGRELLRRRLEDLGIGLASWRRLADSHRTLVILDGFDEMSGDLSRRAIVQNIELLRDCCEEFARSKILITSRANVFGSADDQRQILERVGRPRIFRLAAVERREVLRSLRGRATSPRLHQAIDRLQTLHDPIGLATKPLYYEMIQRTLPSLPDMSFDEHILYEKYVLDTLHRKLKLLEDEDRRNPPEDVVANLMTILEQVAVDLHRSAVPYVCLRDLDDRARRSGGPDVGLAHLLWRIRDDSDSGARYLHDDATARIGIRSLLKRAPGGDEARWPVTFFHRSVQEYFVARGIARAIRGGPHRARPLLAESLLPPEIRRFVVLILRAVPEVSAATTLKALVQGARLTEMHTAVGGNALSLLVGLGESLAGRDLSGLLLDGADLRGADLRGVSFRASSLCWANLDNTDLTDADLRDANLGGVQMEETAAVTAVTALDDGVVVAAYSDRRLRTWVPGSHDASNTAHRVLPFVPNRLWSTPGGALVAAGSAQVAVLQRDRTTWRLVAQFPTQSRYLSPVWRNGRTLLVVEDKTGGRVALWQDPSTGSRRFVSCPTASSWAVDGDGVMAFLSPGSIMVEIDHAGERATVEIGIPRLPGRCVDVRTVDDGIDLIYGNDRGEVTYHRIDRVAGRWRARLVWRAPLHERPVDSVCFLSGDRLVSGSGDQSVCVLPLHQVGGAYPVNVIRLHVKYRCRGTRIAGVQGERERVMLSRLRDA